MTEGIFTMKKMLIYLLVLSCLFVTVTQSLTAQAASKSGYTCKKEVITVNRHLVNAQVSEDNKGNLNVITHQSYVPKFEYQFLTWGNGKNAVSKTILKKEVFPAVIKKDPAYRYNTVKLGKRGTIQFISEVYKKKNDWRQVFTMTNSKGKKIVSIDISKKMKSYNENPVKNDLEFGKDKIVDFEVTGKYLDVLIDEKDTNGEEGRIYSVQRFNLKTGKRVRAQRLERKCFAIMDGYLYASDGETKTGYKYSLNGKRCIWESVVNKEFWTGHDAVGKNLYFIKEDGIYKINTSINNSKPKLIISSKECPVLNKEDTFKYLYVDNKNHFYLVVDFYTSYKKHLYEFTKK